MGGDRNRVHLISAGRHGSWPDMTKTEVGARLAARIAETSQGRGMKVGIKRLPHAQDLPLPHYATPGSAGLDLLAAMDGESNCCPAQRMAVPCGIAIELPLGVEAQVRPRSGLALNHGITCLNAPGTIDSDYRGEIKAHPDQSWRRAVQDLARRQDRPDGDRPP